MCGVHNLDTLQIDMSPNSSLQTPVTYDSRVLFQSMYIQACFLLSNVIYPTMHDWKQLTQSYSI